jgi:hypothetical protein
MAGTYVIRKGSNGAGFLGAGTSTARFKKDQANLRFMDFNFENGATSGDNRAMYLRMYHSGAGGGGEALRVFTTVQNVAAATVHGAHVSLNFASTGTVTGQGIAGRFTLHLKNEALTSNVTMAAVQAEIYSDGSLSDPGGSTKLSYFRAVNDGVAEGIADVDDDAVLFELIGMTAASGNLVSANTADECQLNFTNWVTLRIDIGGTKYYIPAAQTVAAVSS